MTTIYGIKHCDTMKKARAWLEAQGIDYTFHDYKAVGVTPERVRGWVERLGWEAVLNRAGTTFRKLSDANKAGIDADKAVALMVAQPSMIKRPMLEHGDTLVAGFKPDRYAALFG
ncbi:ArsC family reductase [Sphingomonas sp. MA1305]|uniref:ArsC family reductase n=1 Tax=Sphingomonas sp. MA1305 TaxID=2479204 RepID=UPI0018DF6A0A|nr:ArsC family reductase [Sphingomonas sp. MA1305]MBI0475243.1 ArsC family reductase [Sphingomonas sp. MA1305]